MLSKNQIKEIQSLHLKKNRDALKLFIVEGIKSTVEIITGQPGLIKTVYGTADFLQRHGALMNEKNISYFLVAENDLKKISMQASPNSALAVCYYFTAAPPAKGPQGFMIYLDDIRDPGNFGTIVRLAGWFGLTTIYCSPDSCDIYNPKVIQSTMGSFLRVHVNYQSLADVIAAEQIKNVYGAVLDGNNIYKQSLEPGLLVIGNEANGISDENMRLLTKRITIPSGGVAGAESLNAAMAASIMASEFFRQLS